jgi:glyoxylase-like metal-dependent hydrolase (beta-lactamase superfamily II)
MKRFAGLAALLAAFSLHAQPGNLDVHWLEGAEDCESASQAPLQVHRYEPQTYILRESPCADFEAPFMYLLIGSRQALLIDTGAVEDPERVPLARTVMELLPSRGDAKLPLIVVHTHSHSDHHAGDAQFAGLQDVKVAPTDLEPMEDFLGFDRARWPDTATQIDLGDRIVEALPTPGHHPTHVVFYDSRTQVLFSGDFMLPGRLLIDDLQAYRLSAARAVEFVRTRPVSHVLGAHIELDASGEPYTSGTQDHPNERPLQLEKSDLLALPAALQDFNGFYARHPTFILSNPMHNLLAFALVALIAIVLAILATRSWLRRRRTRA